MKNNKFIFMVIVFSFIFPFAGCSKPSATIKSLQIFEPWGRPADKGENSAAYMVIKNVGSTDDNLIKAESPAADMVEIHQTMMKDNVMSMSPVKGISVPSKGQAVLKPDSFHVMLMSLTKKLTPGDKISLDLTFEKAGRINVQAEIRKQ